MKNLDYEIAEFNIDSEQLIKDLLNKDADKLIVELKNTSPIGNRTSYAKDWTKTEIKNDNSIEVYNKQGYLVHILEKDHESKTGSIVKAQPHVKPAVIKLGKRLEKSLANAKIEKYIKKSIKKG